MKVILQFYIIIYEKEGFMNKKSLQEIFVREFIADFKEIMEEREIENCTFAIE